MKKYEYDYTTSNLAHSLHFYAPSDWLRDVKSGEVYMGGNLLAVARSYVEGKTGTIDGTCSSAGYIIAIPAGEIPATLTASIDIDNYVAATYGISSATLRDDTVGDCDVKFPGLKSYLTYTVEQKLDYLMDYEDYRQNLISCGSFDNYKTNWNDFNDTVNEFKIAPLAVYSAGGGADYSIKNVPPGEYYLYRVDGPTHGQLFTGATFNALGSNPVTVTTGQVSPANF